MGSLAFTLWVNNSFCVSQAVEYQPSDVVSAPARGHSNPIAKGIIIGSVGKLRLASVLES